MSKSPSSASGRLSTFFRSVIQPTDSTITGCRANTAAANHAPGTARRVSSIPNSPAAITCSTTFST